MTEEFGKGSGSVIHLAVFVAFVVSCIVVFAMFAFL